MATDAEVEQLRRLADEADDDGEYTNTDLSSLIDVKGSVSAAAAQIWLEKAAGYSTKVDITEAGSSRKNSDLYAHAMEMAKMHGATEGGDAATSAGSTTRAIVRA